MISSYLNTYRPVYYFAWQGGEPTLMGPAFCKKVVDFQTKYGVEFNTLTLVSAANADHAKTVYHYLCNHLKKSR